MRLFYTILPVVACLPAICQAQLYGDYSVRVEVEGNGYAHYTTVYFEDESWATYGYDNCCEALFNLGQADQPQIYTKAIADPIPQDNRISINAFPHVFEHTPIPLGFLPGTLAQYSFTFKQLGTIPAGITVELEDLSLAVTQDLLLDSTYDTWGAVSDPADRFIIHFNPDFTTRVVDKNNRALEENVRWVETGSGLEFYLVGDISNRVVVLDMLGQVLGDAELHQGSPRFRINTGSNQMLVINVTNKSGNNWTRKAFVKNF
jgi:hypothetical protein